MKRYDAATTPIGRGRGLSASLLDPVKRYPFAQCGSRDRRPPSPRRHSRPELPNPFWASFSETTSRRPRDPEHGKRQTVCRGAGPKTSDADPNPHRPVNKGPPSGGFSWLQSSVSRGQASPSRRVICSIISTTLAPRRHKPSIRIPAYRRRSASRSRPIVTACLRSSTSRRRTFRLS